MGQKFQVIKDGLSNTSGPEAAILSCGLDSSFFRNEQRVKMLGGKLTTFAVATSVFIFSKMNVTASFHRFNSKKWAGVNGV